MLFCLICDQEELKLAFLRRVEALEEVKTFNQRAEGLPAAIAARLNINFEFVR